VATAPRIEADRDQVLEELVRLKGLAPRRPLMGIAGQMAVCPTALIEGEDWDLLALEGAVREYGAGYLAVYGYDPAPSQILEALDVIRQTRNEIDARKMQASNTQGGASG